MWRVRFPVHHRMRTPTNDGGQYWGELQVTNRGAHGLGSVCKMGPAGGPACNAELLAASGGGAYGAPG